jgi:hypothetical protein
VPATLLLDFSDPSKYVIGDWYPVAVLFDKDRAIGLSDHPRMLAELRDRNPRGFDLQTLEKAVYWKYRDEQDVSR